MTRDDLCFSLNPSVERSSLNSTKRYFVTGYWLFYIHIYIYIHTPIYIYLYIYILHICYVYTYYIHVHVIDVHTCMRVHCTAGAACARRINSNETRSFFEISKIYFKRKKKEGLQTIKREIIFQSFLYLSENRGVRSSVFKSSHS